MEIKQRKLALLQQRKNFEVELPHLYGFPWYTWALDFFESTNKVNLLCAANQISKSSTQIRKAIDWATNLKKWPKLWNTHPRQFWYLYPTLDVATSEFEKKWLPEFMPRGLSRDDGQYSWEVDYVRKQVREIQFRHKDGTELAIVFKAYTQDVMHLQTGTVHAIFCDEELPVDLYDELFLRLAAVDGYFHMVFTATLNQDFWRRAIEPQKQELEVLPEAWKKQVSMYECLKYADGRPTPWTEPKIEKIKQSCRSEAEVQRRVYGRFITEEGRIFHAFNGSRHFIKPVAIPFGWSYYSAVDIGSGGASGHPAAFVIIAVRPDNKLGYVYRAWRGDGVQTTASDILEKYQNVRGRLKPVVQAYDFASKDFGVIAGRMGESFVKAEKDHKIGEDLLNTLFKNDMLLLFDDEQTRKLGGELSSLMHSTPKNKRIDDLADSLRYCVTQIPWDTEDFAIEFGEIKQKPRVMTEEEYLADEIRRRRGVFIEPNRKGQSSEWEEISAEFDFWNEQYG